MMWVIVTLLIGVMLGMAICGLIHYRRENDE